MIKQNKMIKETWGRNPECKTHHEPCECLKMDLRGMEERLDRLANPRNGSYGQKGTSTELALKAFINQELQRQKEAYKDCPDPSYCPHNHESNLY